MGNCIICDNCKKSLYEDHRSSTEFMGNGKGKNFPFVEIQKGQFHVSSGMGFLRAIELNNTVFCNTDCLREYLVRHIETHGEITDYNRSVNFEGLGF